MVRPTEEQEHAVDKFKTRCSLTIAAFAGAGKTSTLMLLAKTRPSRGLYLAFNESIATEASEKFPNTVECRTTHSIAYRSVMPAFQSNPKLSNALHPKQLAEIAGYTPRVFGEHVQLTGTQQAHVVLGTIRRFCQSADPSITDIHVPRYGRLL